MMQPPQCAVWDFFLTPGVLLVEYDTLLTIHVYVWYMCVYIHDICIYTYTYTYVYMCVYIHT